MYYHAIDLILLDKLLIMILILHNN